MTNTLDETMNPTTATLREAARAAVLESAGECARYSHERNYHKLHIRRDGTLSWFESINKSDDIIDRDAVGFAPIPSVVCVGTGSYLCNCDHCDMVYDPADEAAALEQGYDRLSYYATREDAIDGALADSDLIDAEVAMLAEFDKIPAGYFADEAKRSY